MFIKTRLNLKTILISLFLLTVSTPAFAINVTVDPGQYKGFWNPNNEGFVTGIKTVDFPAGSSSFIKIRNQGSVYVDSNGISIFAGALILINVDSSGNVTVQEPAGSAIGGPQTLTFNTIPIEMDPAAYTGQYHVSGGFLTGPQTIHTIPGFKNMIIFIARFDQQVIEIDSSGNVLPAFVTSIGDSADSFTFSGNTVTFKNVDIQIDPGAYNCIGCFYDLRQATTSLSGAQTITVVPAVSYILEAGVWGKFITVDFDGTVLPGPVDARGDASDSFTFVGSTITFKTVAINFNPSDYVGSFKLRLSSPVLFGADGLQTLTVIQDFEYLVNIGSGFVQIAVDVNGNTSPGFNEKNPNNSFQFTGNLITFNTVSITYTPEDQSILYLPSNSIAHLSGTQTLPAVLDTLHRLRLADRSQTFFNVDFPCAIIPSETVVVGTEPNTETFQITCPNPIVDTDEDGVPDTSDNCPLTSNSDQLDQDNDGIGDVCDLDLDGDGVENLDDNCPNIANTEQDDLDSDGIGDACDLDTDGDSVPDGADNCPLTPNTDQADSDGDGIGDVCDPDDDNDGVLDGADNCRLTANPDQADSDGDGNGDACDSDVDGDGVQNELDVCPGTPSGLAITSDGCSGAQFIELTCPVEEFPNHGRFVSCVAHTANDLVDFGLISPKEKARFVNQAAKK